MYIVYEELPKIPWNSTKTQVFSSNNPLLQLDLINRGNRQELRLLLQNRSYPTSPKPIFCYPPPLSSAGSKCSRRGFLIPTRTTTYIIWHLLKHSPLYFCFALLQITSLQSCLDIPLRYIGLTKVYPCRNQGSLSITVNNPNFVVQFLLMFQNTGFQKFFHK